MSLKYIQFVKTKWFIAAASLLLGAAIVLGIRFATYKVASVHYHANFALYINGQQEQFKGMQYYTEVNGCVLNHAVKQPIERVHMHDNINNVIHVEDNSVTWGQFFTNLGWTMGPTFIVSPDGTVYSENSVNKLNLILNGQDYTDFGGLQNSVIADKDKLLVNYGNESSSQLKLQYSSIPTTAKKYDTTKDPASCSGNHNTTFHDRFVNMM